jgi:hypothetical protein
MSRTFHGKSLLRNCKTITMSSSGEASTFDPQDKFVEAISNFLKALLHKFRKDPEVVATLKTQHSRLNMMVIDASEKVRRAAGRKLVMAFHQAMSPFYQRIMSMDKRVPFDIKHDIFVELDFPKLFSRCSEKVQGIMFKHLQAICRFSSLCASTDDVPGNVMSQVYGISAKMAEAQKKGESVNFGDVWKQAEKIVKEADKSDQKAIAKSMQEGGMQNLISMVMGGNNNKKKKKSKKTKARQKARGSQKKRSRKRYSDSDDSDTSDSDTGSSELD